MSRQPPRCGTYAGYHRHKRLREEVDEACREAAAAEAKRRRDRARQGQGQSAGYPGEQAPLGGVRVRAVPAGDRRAAALAICGRATDIDDARRLLDMVGLLPDRTGTR